MSNHRWVTDEEMSRTEAAMIGAARHERPRAGARDRTLAAVGLAGAVSSAAATANGAGAALASSVATGATTALPAGGAVAGASGSIGVLLLGKWFGMGAAVALVGLGAMEHVTSSRNSVAREAPAVVSERSTPSLTKSGPASEATPPAPVTTEAPVAVDPAHASLALPSFASPPAPARERVAREGRAPIGVREKNTASAAPSTDGTETNGLAGATSSADIGALNDEVARLDEVRTALAVKQPAMAQMKLDAYRRVYPAGLMRDEALLLDIEVAMALGRQADAMALAQRFITAHPRSPYFNRVRALVGR